MSYDLSLYTVKPPVLDGLLNEDENWHKYESSICYEKKNWQIVITAPDKIEAEDIPEPVAGSIPGIEYLVGITLEPMGAPKSAYALLNKTAKQLGQQSHGVIFNPQEDEAILPTGVKRFVRPKREERFASIQLSWWFRDSFFNTKDELGEFLTILETKVPEALPKRYGLYEPPQYKFTETGLRHFQDFLWDNLDDIVVWYPTRPVTGVHIGWSKEHIHSVYGFRTNYLEIEFERAVLLQPGWDRTLKELWREVSILIKPFYGDVRTLHGNLWSGASSASDMQTEFHPIRAGFWRGIPIELGHASVIGKPYIHLWPNFVEKGTLDGELCFLDSDNWLSGLDLTSGTVKVPTDISLRHTPKWTKNDKYGGYVQNWNDEYPPVWPFGEVPKASDNKDQETIESWWNFWKK